MNKKISMEELLWLEIKNCFNEKVNIRKLSRETGIDNTRLWRLYNFRGRMKLSDYEKLFKWCKHSLPEAA